MQGGDSHVSHDRPESKKQPVFLLISYTTVHRPRTNTLSSPLLTPLYPSLTDPTTAGRQASAPHARHSGLAHAGPGRL